MRAWAAFLMLFLFLSQSTHGAENDSAPPSIPEGEGAVACRAFFSNGTAAANQPVILLASSNESQSMYRLFADSQGMFLLTLSSGVYSLDAIIDMPDSSGMDFASTSRIDTAGGKSATLIFYPAGSLSGKVEYNGAPIEALVRVSCPSEAFDYARINGASEAQTGDAGDFLFRALPAGKCIVSAVSGELAGSAEASIMPGGANSVLVEVERKQAPLEGGSSQGIFAGILPAAAAIAVILAVIAFYLFFFGKGRAEGKLQPAKHEALPAKAKPLSGKIAEEKNAAKEAEGGSGGYDMKNPKAKAVLATLSEREREIVGFLFKCHGRAKRSSIQHKLLIPKTSLLRNLRSLERKNIVKLTPFGRNLLAEIEGSLFE